MDLLDQEKVRVDKVNKLRSLGYDPYKITELSFNTTVKDLVDQYTNTDEQDLDDVELISCVGRVCNIRLPFMVIVHNFAKIQVYIPKSEKQLQTIVDLVDLGDYLLVKGKLFFTKTKQLTIRVSELTVIAKALLPFPDSYYGFEDTEQKLRKRYLDSLLHKDVYDIFIKRHQIIRLIRKYLDDQGYIEVESPILQSIYGGANAKPFSTYHNALKQNFYLRIATEIPLKKMVIGGYEKVYEIGKCFRNEGIDSTHNPEFTSIEIYTAFISFSELINLTQSLIHFVATQLSSSGEHVDDQLLQSFRIIKMTDLIKDKIGVDFYNENIDLTQALSIAQKYNIELQNHQKTVGHIIMALFEQLCEKDISQPTFVTHYPKDVSVLAKTDNDNDNFTYRFELYINAKEYGNGFCELSDPFDQYERFVNQKKESQLGYDECIIMDDTFITALKYGLVPCCGVGLGIDRLVNLFTRSSSIKDVIYFPTLKKESD